MWIESNSTESIIITDLRYADDVLLMADKRKKMQKMIDRLNKTCKAYGMKINVKTIKVVVVVIVVEINVHLPSKDNVEDAPCLRTSNHSTSSSSCKFKDTGGGQDGARPFIKESTEDGRLWRKK